MKKPLSLQEALQEEEKRFILLRDEIVRIIKFLKENPTAKVDILIRNAKKMLNLMGGLYYYGGLSYWEIKTNLRRELVDKAKSKLDKEIAEKVLKTLFWY